MEAVRGTRGLTGLGPGFLRRLRTFSVYAGTLPTRSLFYEIPYNLD